MRILINAHCKRTVMHIVGFGHTVTNTIKIDCYNLILLSTIYKKKLMTLHDIIVV